MNRKSSRKFLTVGRRTGALIVPSNKTLKLNKDGIESFADYWQSSDSSREETPSPKNSSPIGSGVPRFSSLFVKNNTNERISFINPSKSLYLEEQNSVKSSPKSTLKKVNLETINPLSTEPIRNRMLYTKGRRTGCDILLGKEIHASKNIEDFKDYWTDTCSDNTDSHLTNIDKGLSPRRSLRSNTSVLASSNQKHISLNFDQSNESLDVPSKKDRSNSEISITTNMPSETLRKEPSLQEKESFESAHAMTADSPNPSPSSGSSNRTPRKSLRINDIQTSKASPNLNISKGEKLVNNQKCISLNFDQSNELLDVSSKKNRSNSEISITTNMPSETLRKEPSLQKNVSLQEKESFESAHAMSADSPNPSPSSSASNRTPRKRLKINDIQTSKASPNFNISKEEKLVNNQKCISLNFEQSNLFQSNVLNNTVSRNEVKNTRKNENTQDFPGKKQNSKSKTIKRKKSPVSTANNPENDQADSETVGIRRSTRQRIAPLESWRLERRVFGYRDGEIVNLGYEKGFPEDTSKKINKKQIKKSTQKPKKKDMKLIDNSTNMELIQSSVNKISVSNPDTGGEELLYLHRPYDTLLWSIPPSVDQNDPPYTISKSMSGELISFGYIEIGVSKEKKKQFSPSDNITFTVIKGNVKVKINKQVLCLKELDKMTIPSANSYSVKNTGKIPALLSFCTYQVPLFDYQFQKYGEETE